MKAKQIFEAIKLGNLQLKNRLVRSATWEDLGGSSGDIPEKLFEIYHDLAAGGVGAIISGFTAVSSSDDCFGGMVRLSGDALIPNHKRLTDLAHEHDCPILAQIALGAYNRDEPGSFVKDLSIDAMTKADIEKAKGLFVEAACRAEKAGYDGVQLHAAHGFFLSRFISPAYNHRADEYGGSAKSRGRIVVEIQEGIRKKCPALHISMKINCSDFGYGGLSPEESLTICRMCADAGLDSIEVSGSGTSRPGIRPGVNEAYFKEFAIQLGEEVDVPIILVGGHRSIDNIEKVLNEGRIDCLSLSRPLIREPNLPNRWMNGETEPAKCVSCNSCYNTPGHACIFNLRRG